MDHFERAVDALDAAVFSGDGLHDAANRQLLTQSIARWQRRISECEVVTEDDLAGEQ